MLSVVNSCEPPSPIRGTFSIFCVGKPENRTKTRREVGFFPDVVLERILTVTDSTDSLFPGFGSAEMQRALADVGAAKLDPDFGSVPGLAMS